MKRMKILVNTISTKKHSGGAYQISYNFLIKTAEHPEIDWVYVISSDLDEILPDTLKKKGEYYVFPTQPDFKHSYKRVKKELTELEKRIKPDVVYSITAPSYFTFKAKEVMRFTNPWVTHPNKYSWSTLNFFSRIKQRMYCWNQKRLMKAAYAFVTQTETTKKGIISITGKTTNKVCVVNNVLPGVFKTMDVTPIEDEEWVNVACIGNPVPHKNFDILPQLIKELNKIGLNNVRFHTTIPFDSPMESKVINPLKELGLQSHIVNHGRVSQEQLGGIYRRCQLCFLPTLLEVFSASTLEAMYYRLPIIATNFDFNTEVLEDCCLYYEPKKAVDAACQFAKMIKSKALQEECRRKMQRQLSKYGNYDAHFNAIKDYLIKVGEGNI